MWYIWSCKNLYEWMFSSKLFVCKGGRVSLIYSKDNGWGRAPMASLFSWWILRRFNLLLHNYVGFTNIYICERLSYNPFNCISIIFTVVFFTWCDLTSYSIILPISIYALVFLLWSICYICIIYGTFTLDSPTCLSVSV